MVWWPQSPKGNAFALKSFANIIGAVECAKLNHAGYAEWKAYHICPMNHRGKGKCRSSEDL